VEEHLAIFSLKALFISVGSIMLRNTVRKLYDTFVCSSLRHRAVANLFTSIVIALEVAAFILCS